MSTASAPVEIGQVALIVNDLEKVARFYETALGLVRLSGDAATVLLGAGGKGLLELRSDPAARRPRRQEAGLFHTAFLLPDRAALGAWLRHATRSGIRLTGASDHLVSEAIYLDDPEGNGIEVYRDRPRLDWPRENGRLKMANAPLDAEAILASATGPWRGAPDGTVIGHVHLQVGDIAHADAFLRDRLGFAVMAQYPGAHFYGSGGYHHHFGANVWNSAGAGPRTGPATGLAEVTLFADPEKAADLPDRLTDPWGTRFTVIGKTAVP